MQMKGNYILQISHQEYVKW